MRGGANVGVTVDRFYIKMIKKIKIISDQKYGKSAQHRYLCGLILWDLT